MSQDASFKAVVVAPVYDDALAAGRLAVELRDAFQGKDVSLRLLFVDDGSPVPVAEQLQAPYGIDVQVLRLKRNVGHQRAIALGLAHVHEHLPCDAVLVMDADGEDRPEDALRLVTQCRSGGLRSIVFAERTRRSESLLFQVLYRLYQAIHWLLTGIRVKVGNFSAIPGSMLGSIVTLPALWNHYAAALFQARLPRELLPTARGQRYFGSSKMNLPALVIHGLQAISVFIEIVAVRLLLFQFFLAVVCGALLILTTMTPGLEGSPLFFTGLLAVVLGLGLGFFSLTLGLLAQRNRMDFIPCRDYRLFVAGVNDVPFRETEDLPYVGGELDLFARARRWKAYWMAMIRPHLGSNVLEVGAGIGTNTMLLLNGASRRWLCLEPDANLAARLEKNLQMLPASAACTVKTGTVSSLSNDSRFDTILYIDVLEHIENDAAELSRAAAHLSPGGKLIVLSPAHQWLFSEFDRSIGHHRRYTRATLSALKPPGLELVRCFYLDAVGLLASAANRCLLRQSLPTAGQIALWDSVMIPLSRVTDPLIARSLGKTVVAIWAKPS